MPYGKPVYLRPASRGGSRWRFFAGGMVLGGLMVFFAMSAWNAHRPVEVVVQSSTPSTVNGAVTVVGLANPADGNVAFRITELVRGKAVVIGSGEVATKSTIPGTHGTFTATVSIVPSREQGTLEVSVHTNAPDRALDTVVIPLKFVVHKETPAPTPKPVPPKPTPTPAAVSAPAESQ
jgi:hypothetical protein